MTSAEAGHFIPFPVHMQSYHKQWVVNLPMAFSMLTRVASGAGFVGVAGEMGGASFTSVRASPQSRISSLAVGALGHTVTRLCVFVVWTLYFTILLLHGVLHQKLNMIYNNTKNQKLSGLYAYVILDIYKPLN